MIAIIDYGVGNLKSVEKAVQYVGGDAYITSDINVILNAIIVRCSVLSFQIINLLISNP